MSRRTSRKKKENLLLLIGIILFGVGIWIWSGPYAGNFGSIQIYMFGLGWLCIVVGPMIILASISRKIKR